MFGYSREAVRIKVKKCEGKLPPELRKFSVDPQITSLEVLQSILLKAFDIKNDFTISYRTNDDFGNEINLPILSDWDLDAAFLKAHNISVSQQCEPCIQLQIDTRLGADSNEEWEPSFGQSTLTECAREASQMTTSVETKQSGLQGMIMNQMEKTLSIVSKALNFYEDPSLPPRPPLSDAEFRTCLDSGGKVVYGPKLRDIVYCGGIDPSLRKVVWKHILNVYPDGMTGRERMDYMKRKSAEYYQLRNKWKESLQKGQVNSDLAYVTSMVRKDVLRTDRHHPFYAGSDDNQNIASLFNILTTYAVNHPSVSYCQGMSDLASPLLVTMIDEAHAYICLCALLSRLYQNFMLDGDAMTLKFAHLTDALQAYDPEFYAYLKLQQADDLLFCYRWLLLEMKREFAFEDALRMLEVLWASLPPKPPAEELPLKNQEFDPSLQVGNGEPQALSPHLKTPRETAYTKFCAIRRQSSAFSLHKSMKSNNTMGYRHINYSLDENVTRNPENIILKVAKEYQSLDDAVLRVSKQISPKEKNKVEHVISECIVPGEIEPLQDDVFEKNEIATEAVNIDKDACDTASQNAPLGSQIRQLRNRLTQHNNKFYASLEKLDTFISSIEKSDPDEVPQVKLIKNLNEFLTFANKESCSKLRKENIQRTQSSTEPTECDKFEINKRSLEENDVPFLSGSTKRKNPNPRKKQSISSSLECNSPDDSQEYYPMTTSMTKELNIELEHLDRQVLAPVDQNLDNKNDDGEIEFCANIEAFQSSVKTPAQSDEFFIWNNPIHSVTPNSKSGQQTPDEQIDLELDGEAVVDAADLTLTKINQVSSSISSDTESLDSESKAKEPLLENAEVRPHKFFSNMSQELENAKRNCEQLLKAKQNHKLQSVAATINNFQRKYEMLKSPNLNQRVNPPNAPRVPPVAHEIPNTKWTVNNLPPPEEFGGGNPFLMFLCLTLLLQHRDYIMRNRMDYNELAMHFDKMVRKHNVNRVLNQARQMYVAYLKQHPKLNNIST